jgi:AcrR family transcriptional regulator
LTARPAVAVTAPDAPHARERKLRRGPLTRKQILDAALRLFSEKGFARTSVRDIAQAAGITDAAIYYHFDSKRVLFEALIEERGFCAALESLETVEVAIPPSEALPELGLSALAFIYQNRDLMKVLMLEAMADDPVATEEYAMLVERWERACARIFRIYLSRDEIHIDSADELAKQCVVTVLGAFADYLMSPAASRSGDPDPPPALMEHVRTAMQQIVRGIT